ncbi:MAG: hypothetical protein LUG85_00770 [Clostridiales bacterium]|nr:hypothetical protein [Clostridiales bacterium]
MKNKLKKYAAIAFAALLGMLFIVKHDIVADSIKESLTLCGEVLIPSMLPFMVLSSFALYAGLFSSPGKPVTLFMNRVFHLPGSSFQALFFGFTGGYPVGARTIAELYENGQINKGEAEHLFAFCINSGPAFTVSAAGGIMLHSQYAGYIMLVSVCLASAAVGIALGIVRRKEAVSDLPVAKATNNMSDALIEGVSAAERGIFSVCVWLLTFSAFSAVTDSFIKVSVVRAVYEMITEVTAGVSAAAHIGGLPLCSACISFGGLCVMCQLVPSMKKCGIKIKKYLLFRIINSILTYVISEIILLIVPVDISVSSSYDFVLYSSTAPAGAALVIMGGLLIYELSSGETGKIKLGDILG